MTMRNSDGSPGQRSGFIKDETRIVPVAVHRPYPEGTVVRYEEMDPLERAFGDANHEDCTDPPAGHSLAEHSPWSGADLDGTEPWPEFVARLARHGLAIVQIAVTPRPLSAEPLTEEGREALAAVLAVMRSVPVALDGCDITPDEDVSGFLSALEGVDPPLRVVMSENPTTNYAVKSGDPLRYDHTHLWVCQGGCDLPKHDCGSDAARAAITPEAESYVRGHWDGLHCDADTGFGLLDECEHVGRIHEPKVAALRVTPVEGEAGLDWHLIADRIETAGHEALLGNPVMAHWFHKDVARIRDEALAALSPEEPRS